MNRTAISILTVFLCSVLAPPGAHAQQELAAAKNCLACHGVERKILGPAFKDVATKYAGQAGVADRLAAKVIKGGAGVWGPVPMPANPQVSEAEARQLVEWILALK